MKNNCFYCQQKVVHMYLYESGMISEKGFIELQKLWKDCEHKKRTTGGKII